MDASHDQMDRVDRALLVGSGGARRVHGGQGQEDVKESEKGCFRVQQVLGQAANESAGGRKTKESSEGPEYWTIVSVDETIIDEFQVSSKTTDNCVEPTIIQSIVVKRKLSQSEGDRMVQEAEKSRDEDDVNESKHEGESGWDKIRVIVETQTDGIFLEKIQSGDGHG